MDGELSVPGCYSNSIIHRLVNKLLHTTLKEEIFYGRNFCGIYFCDFDPYSQKFIPQKKFKIDQSQKFIPKFFFKMMPFETVWLIYIFCLKIKRILLCFK